MADRIEELRRRVEKNPASIAFAALAEEYRRAGWFQEAITTCRAGLEHHPAFLSPRVTLGRALIEMGELEQAAGELEYVLRAAPENLAAIRAMAEIHDRQGEIGDQEAYSTMAASAAAEPGLHLAAQQATPEAAAPLSLETATPLPLEVATPASAEAVGQMAEPASVTPSPAPVVPPAEVAALPALQKFLEAVLATRAQRRPLA